MTPESAALLATWRMEVVVALEAARSKLPPLEHEHEQAIAAAHAAESALELQRILEAAFTRVAGPLAQRIAWLRSAADEAKALAARAAVALRNARADVVELQRALVQADHVAPEERIEAAA